jgi:hypothetical protein
LKWSDTIHVKAEIVTKEREEIVVIKNMANVEITVPRYTDQHRFIFAVIRRTLDMCVPFKAIRTNSEEDFLNVFKTYAGLIESFDTPFGIDYRKKSLSFNNMDQVEFGLIAPKIIDFCFILLSYGPSEHIDSLNDFIREVEYKYNCRVNR